MTHGEVYAALPDGAYRVHWSVRTARDERAAAAVLREWGWREQESGLEGCDTAFIGGIGRGDLERALGDLEAEGLHPPGRLGNDAVQVAVHLMAPETGGRWATVSDWLGTLPSGPARPWGPAALAGAADDDAEYRRGWEDGYAWVMRDPRAAYEWEWEVYREMKEPSWYDMGKSDVITEHRVAHAV